MKKALTDALVRSVVPPASGRVELTDERCAGLTLRVTAAGVRSWSFRFRDPRSGGVTRATIGSYPDLSLSDARERATDLRRAVARGLNPVEQKRQGRAEAASRTFDALAERYLAEHARRFKRSASVDERNLRLHVLPEWGRRRFDQIERRDVIALVEGLVTAGKPVLANRVQALVSMIYTFALDADLVTANPCSRLRRRGVETARERVLSDAELRIFWPAIVRPTVSRVVGLALRLELLTGVRPGEAAGMRRDELEHLDDPKRAGWVIPASRVKTKKPHYVPLAPMARATILEALELVSVDQPFVFASSRKSEGPTRSTALPTAMMRFAAALDGDDPGVATWNENPPTPHDLRRTVGTRLSAMGFSREDRKAVLGHAEGDVHGKHYDLHDRAAEKRRVLTMWANALQDIVTGIASTNVLPLRAGRPA